MKTLTIEHICGYIPHGLKAMDAKTKEIREVTIKSFTYPNTIVGINHLTWETEPFVQRHIPVLIPLDRLTDAQYAEVGRIMTHGYNNPEYRSAYINMGKVYSAGGRSLSLSLTTSLEIVTYLHSLRCDISGLIPAGLAISAYDLPENPYL